MNWETFFPEVDPRRAAERLRGVVKRTPLQPFPSGDPRVELRLKLECLQESGSFKARGAWNQVALLGPEERARGVVAISSGNHATALAWAARRAGVRATVCMPADAYPNKIAACRALGAEVVLGATRDEADRACKERVAAGQVLVHPYDAARTAEGAGTVGLEIAEDWPAVELVIVQVGGGGLITGTSLALKRALGDRVRILGIEPRGAPTLTLGLEAGAPVKLERIETAVQGLCPPNAGKLAIEACARTLAGVVLVDDPPVFRAQAKLVNQGGWTVEPAGAAAAALVLEGLLPVGHLVGRSAANPLRVAAVVSGGNPDPAQLEGVRRGASASG